MELLKSSIRGEKLDAVFISSVSNISYLTDFTNFSKDEREAYLLIGEDFAYIITDGRYIEAVRKQVKNFTIFERGGGKNTEDLFKKLNSKIKSLGIEEDNLTVAEYKIVKKHFKKLKHFNVEVLRSLKNDNEIEKIKKACFIGDKAFKYILTRIKTGVTEKKIAFEIEKFVKSQGADLSFPSIVAFGKNSSIPHHQTGEKGLATNDKLVLLDFGVKWENYCSDMTRTIFFGQPTKSQKEIYQVVYEAQQKAVDFLNSKIKLGEKVTGAQVDKTAREYIKSKGFPDIPHSLGHGIGLEVHEQPYLSPKSKEVLKEGMVFSIEPGIYLPDFGSPRFGGEAGGVRIEDLFVVEKMGLKQITTSSKEIIKI